MPAKTPKKPVPRHVSMVEAWKTLGDLVDAAENGHIIIITRFGRPVVQMTSISRDEPLAES